jgi:hypothetical protein
MTESGKTTLAKRLAARYKSNDVPVVVLDSLNDPEWICDYQTTDPDEFLRVFWASKRCACFIDEAGDAVGRYDTAMQKTATRGRHWGHSVHYISQRGVQIAPTVRDQCGHIFLLTSSLADSKVHANEWNQPQLLKANSLRKGNYFHATRFGECTTGSLFGVAQDGFNTDNGNGDRRVPGEKADKDAAPQIGEKGDGGNANGTGISIDKWRDVNRADKDGTTDNSSGTRDCVKPGTEKRNPAK